VNEFKRLNNMSSAVRVLILSFPRSWAVSREESRIIYLCSLSGRASNSSVSVGKCDSLRASLVASGGGTAEQIGILRAAATRENDSNSSFGFVVKLFGMSQFKVVDTIGRLISLSSQYQVAGYWR
jgi:hypothetical protein